MFTRSPLFSSMGALGLGVSQDIVATDKGGGMPKLSGSGVWEGPRKSEAMV